MSLLIDIFNNNSVGAEFFVLGGESPLGIWTDCNFYRLFFVVVQQLSKNCTNTPLLRLLAQNILDRILAIREFKNLVSLISL